MGEKCRLYADIHSLQANVTGSGNLLVANFPDGTTESILIDFGLHQESDNNADLNSKIGFNPKDLAAILLTHAHIDHCGRIPMLYKNGATCKTIMTKDTGIIAEKLLLNTANIISSNDNQVTEQIYTMQDCEKAMREFRYCDYDDELIITSHITVKFLQNQHVPGAAMIFVKISFEEEKNITLLFSGDINEFHAFSDKKTSIPSWLEESELSMLMCESTRKKDVSENGKFKRDIIKILEQKDMTIIIPAFSFCRFQNILLVLKELQYEGEISPKLPIYIDGNLGIDITKIWPKLDTVELKDFMPENVNIVDNRKALMASKNPKIIVTTSGMGNFGPAREYLPHYIEDESAVIYLTGYVSPCTSARIIFDAEKGEHVLVNGINKIKKATVYCTGEFSSHAKKQELIKFVKSFKKVKFLLLAHGTYESKLALSKGCQEKCKNVKSIGIVDGKTVFRVSAHGLVKNFELN